MLVGGKPILSRLGVDRNYFILKIVGMRYGLIGVHSIYEDSIQEFVLNTNCSWSLSYGRDGLYMVHAFDTPMGVMVCKVPEQIHEENLLNLEVQGKIVSVTRIRKCHDGIGFFVNFKVIE